ncbi:hypothetical protein GQ457_08G009610 [Hibiscus cannabinus]
MKKKEGLSSDAYACSHCCIPNDSNPNPDNILNVPIITISIGTKSAPLECEPLLVYSLMELRVNVMYAKDLKRVNHITKMKVYGVVSVNGNARTSLKTPVDKENGSNPEWNCRMKFLIDEEDVHDNLLFLVFALKSRRSLGDRDIGTVQVSVKELLDQTYGKHMVEQHVSYGVVSPEGKSRGILSFSYKFERNLHCPVPYQYHQLPWHDPSRSVDHIRHRHMVTTNRPLDPVQAIEKSKSEMMGSEFNTEG